MLEVKTLRTTRVPNPAEVKPKIMSQIQRLVDKLITDPTAEAAEQELDTVVAELYELSAIERTEVGVES